MSVLEKKLKELRPSLRLVAPQTYWFSVGFAVFNMAIGFAIYNKSVLTTLSVVGVIPLHLWGVIFFVHGLSMLGSLLYNNWFVARFLNLLGIFIKTTWWLELLSITIAGRSPALLIIWSLLLFLQIINYIYFMPRVGHE